MPEVVPPDFATLQALDQPARREWLRAWMERHHLANANQAAKRLGLTRTTVERMVYDPPRSAVTDQTLRVAWLEDRIAQMPKGMDKE